MQDDKVRVSALEQADAAFKAFTQNDCAATRAALTKGVPSAGRDCVGAGWPATPSRRFR